jgi:hypothetical protein
MGMNEFTLIQPSIPSDSYIEIDELVREWEKDPVHKAELEKARKWFCENFDVKARVNTIP